jgi:drug/metabolite transporter (DMT)-like permease
MALRYWSVILILGIGWGMSFMLNAILLREIGPYSVSFLRVLLGALGCWLWVLIARRPVRLSAGRAAALIGFGTLSYAVPFAFYALGQQHVASGVAGIINATTPVFVVAVAHFWPGGEKATANKAAGVACGIAGIVLLSLPVLRQGGSSEAWAVLVILGAPVCYGFSMNIARAFRDMEPVVMVAVALSGAAAAIAPLAIAQEGLPQPVRPETWAALAMIGFVLTSAAFIALYWVLPKVGPANISIPTMVAPVSAILLGTMVLGEELQAAHFGGLAAVLAGLVLMDGRLLWRRSAAPAD